MELLLPGAKVCGNESSVIPNGLACRKLAKRYSRGSVCRNCGCVIFRVFSV